MSKGWIGVDLDGTLAHYDGWKGPAHIGPAIPAMLNRVRQWISDGKVVKIFTARANIPIAIPYIKSWLQENGLPDLEITATKDLKMIELWDDRCVQVEKNTGEPTVEQISALIIEEYEVMQKEKRRSKETEDFLSASFREQAGSNAHLDESEGELQEDALRDVEQLLECARREPGRWKNQDHE